MTVAPVSDGVQLTADTIGEVEAVEALLRVPETVEVDPLELVPVFEVEVEPLLFELVDPPLLVEDDVELLFEPVFPVFVVVNVMSGDEVDRPLEFPDVTWK